MYIIIGAGPTGLQTAIKFHEQGVKDILVVDPRAGEYTRPGHLTLKNLEIAGIKIDRLRANAPDTDKTYCHIKDYERYLFEIAQSLNVQFAKKSFVRLHQGDPSGVIITDGVTEEFIPSDYVFDCTGTQRKVIHNLNALCPTSPLKVNTLTEVATPNRLIAYINIPEQDLQIIRQHMDQSFTEIDSLTYARRILQLRALGWKEFTFPDCYGAAFSKDLNKACLYLETPADLSSQQNIDWFNTVLAGISPKISYTQLKPSRKYLKKSRFTPFRLSINSLENAAYQGDNLPMVIALGDTLIDPHYVLGKGITSGLLQINELFKVLKIADGKILSFSETEYQNKLHTPLHEYQTQLIRKFAREKEILVDAFGPAKLKLQEAAQQTNGSEREAILLLITELEAQKSYLRAQNLFKHLHYKNEQPRFHRFTTAELAAVLIDLKNNISTAAQGLPATFAVERKTLQDLALASTAAWACLATKFLHEKNDYAAIEAVQNSFDIFCTFELESNDIYPKLERTYLSLTALQITQHRYTEALNVVERTLQIYQRKANKTSDELSFCQQIIFDYARFSVLQIKKCLASVDLKEMHLYAERARNVLLENKVFIQEDILAALLSDINKHAPKSVISEQFQHHVLLALPKENSSALDLPGQPLANYYKT